MKVIGYFIRGLWRELICLVDKSRNWYNKLSFKEQFAFWWTIFGAALGIAFSVMVYLQDYTFRIQHGITFINADYWTLVLLAVLSCAAMGAIIVWAVPMGVYAAYYSVKHTIKVGS